MARIPLAYPKMPDSRGAPMGRCVAFEKYDGSNLHWVWEPALGWSGFGTRRDRFDFDAHGIEAFGAAHAGLEAAPGLFQRDLAEPLAEIIGAEQAAGGLFEGAAAVLAFTEFLGAGSFAGKHRAEDDKRLVLFDMAADGRFVEPEIFVERFAAAPIARVVYRGKFTGGFVEDVRRGVYAVAEGVVAKGVVDGKIWMVKVKTDAYGERLKSAFAERWEDYWE